MLWQFACSGKKSSNISTENVTILFCETVLHCRKVTGNSAHLLQITYLYSWYYFTIFWNVFFLPSSQDCHSQSSHAWKINVQRLLSDRPSTSNKIMLSTCIILDYYRVAVQLKVSSCNRNVLISAFYSKGVLWSQTEDNMDLVYKQSCWLYALKRKISLTN